MVFLKSVSHHCIQGRLRILRHTAYLLKGVSSGSWVTFPCSGDGAKSLEVPAPRLLLGCIHRASLLRCLAQVNLLSLPAAPRIFSCVGFFPPTAQIITSHCVPIPGHVFRRRLDNSDVEVRPIRAYNQRQNSGSSGKANAPILYRPSMPLLIPHEEV